MGDKLDELHAKQERSEKREKALRDRKAALARRITREEREQAQIDRAIARTRKERHKLDDKGFCFDGCSVPLVIRLVLLDCRAEGDWNGTLTSGDRTPEHCDACSDKMSQAELFAAAQNGTGAPANPPGTGSHEYVNGGNGGTPAYATKFPVGAKLPSWCLGLDLGDPDGFLAACAKLGYKVHRAHMPREPWHCNFSENPRERLIERGLV